MFFFLFFEKKKVVNLFLQHLKENTWKKNSLISHKLSISFSVLLQMSSAVREIIQNTLAIAWHVRKKEKTQRKNVSCNCLQLGIWILAIASKSCRISKKY